VAAPGEAHEANEWAEVLFVVVDFRSAPRNVPAKMARRQNVDEFESQAVDRQPGAKVKSRWLPLLQTQRELETQELVLLLPSALERN